MSLSAQQPVASDSSGTPAQVLASGVAARPLVRFNGAVPPPTRPQGPAVAVTFTLYRERDDTTGLWTETQNVEPNAEGRYSVLLGATQPDGLPLELFAMGEARWLGARLLLPGEIEQPRVLLVSVPYALKAADAETLGGKPLSAFMLLPEGGAVAGLAATTVAATAANAAGGRGTLVAAAAPVVAAAIGTNYIPMFMDTEGTLGNSVIYQSGANVGVGTTGPLSKLDVNGGVAIGSYAGANPAPANGLIVSGPVGVGNSSPTSVTGASGTLFAVSSSSSDGSQDVIPFGSLFTQAVAMNGKWFYGNYFRSVYTGSGASSGLFTTSFSGAIQRGTGSISDITAHSGNITFGNTGAVSSAAVFRALAPNVSPGISVANQYGFFIDSQGGTGIANAYGIYQGAAADKNFFAGNVGIGTATPSQKLEVAGNVKASGVVFPDGTQTAAGVTGSGTNYTIPQFTTNGKTLSNSVIAQYGNNVGIGTASPSQKLEVNGNVKVNGHVELSGADGKIYFPDGTWISGPCGSIQGTKPVLRIARIIAGAAAPMDACTDAYTTPRNPGNPVASTRATPLAAFHGVSLAAFPPPAGPGLEAGPQAAGTRPEAGDVMSISPGSSGAVDASTEPYSTRVVGVYSMEPDLGGEPSDGGRAKPGRGFIAVAGVTTCKVSAENGAIVEGDLLVTSSVRGHAMKGTDRARMLGAVVAKALEPLSEAAGRIRVLVTLQ